MKTNDLPTDIDLWKILKSGWMDPIVDIFWWLFPATLSPKIMVQWKTTLNERNQKLEIHLGLSPFPVMVTIRIVSCLVGNPYKPSFATITLSSSSCTLVVHWWVHQVSSRSSRFTGWAHSSSSCSKSENATIAGKGDNPRYTHFPLNHDGGRVPLQPFWKLDSPISGSTGSARRAREEKAEIERLDEVWALRWLPLTRL